MKATTLLISTSIARPRTHLGSGFIVIAFALGCLALPHTAQAVSPSPDGGYPGGNTAEGQNALLSLTTGGFNTAVGYFSLRSNTVNSFNTAVGAGALLANSGDPNDGFGQENTATGAGALLSNTTGTFNTANGAFALFSNTAGAANTASGRNALLNNTTGNFNTTNGHGTLLNNTTGNFNTALGAGAGNGVTTANNVIAIGASGANVSDSCFIGNIRGVTTSQNDAIPVVIDFFGQLGTASSSRRFKNEIKPMDSASEAILALRPATFRYKSDKASTPQFGLIAEEVAEVNPDLVVRDKDGQIYTVRYDAVNAMLLNEFLKEHRKVEQLTKEFESKFVQQQKQIEALTAGLERMSAQVETSKPAARVVANEP
jgi:Chaperone of endosialidase